METPDTDTEKRAWAPGAPAWAGLAALALLLVWFYGLLPAYVECRHSATGWLTTAWNAENDYEHGWMVPMLSLYMLHHAWGRLKGVELRGSLHGLWLLALGALAGLLAVRTQQGRIAIASLPLVLTGAAWCYLGGRAALRCAFPFFFLWLSIPLPGFQQATVGMQLLATQGAHWGAGLCGVATVVEGTNIASATGNWDAFNIVGGCSGMRSLMALIMISTAWGYLASDLALWKRITLALSAIPLSIVANAFRLVSIFVFAEYVNPAFASKTWHDWSGLLFFFPASLVCLTLLHGLLAGELPLLKRRRVVVRRNGGAAADTPPDTASTDGKEDRV